MHCLWEGKPPKLPLPWDLVTPSEEDRATAIGNMHKKLVKIARVAPEICWRTDRHTDALITILRHRSRERSNSYNILLIQIQIQIY